MHDWRDNEKSSALFHMARLNEPLIVWNCLELPEIYIIDVSCALSQNSLSTLISANTIFRPTGSRCLSHTVLQLVDVSRVLAASTSYLTRERRIRRRGHCAAGL